MMARWDILALFAVRDHQFVGIATCLRGIRFPTYAKASRMDRVFRPFLGWRNISRQERPRPHLAPAKEPLRRLQQACGVKASAGDGNAVDGRAGVVRGVKKPRQQI